MPKPIEKLLELEVTKAKRERDAAIREVGFYRKAVAAVAEMLRLKKNIVVEFPDEINVANPVTAIEVTNPVKSVSVDNLKPIVDAVKANKPLPHPKSIEIKSKELAAQGKKLDTLAVLMTKMIKAVATKATQVISGEVKITNREAADAIPVVLATADRKSLYNAIIAGFRASGASSNAATIQKQDEIIEAINGADYDQMTVTYPDDTTEVYTYTLGIDVVRTVTVEYTDATKANLLTVTKS